MDQTKVCKGCDSQKMKSDFVSADGHPNPKGRYCADCFAKKQSGNQKGSDGVSEATYEFRVQGAKGKYTTTFQKRPDGIASKCDCKASQKGTACKHRLRILRGDVKGIISDNQADVAIVESWLPGSELGNLISNLKSSEAKAERIEKSIKKIKKSLAKAFQDNSL